MQSAGLHFHACFSLDCIKLGYFCLSRRSSVPKTCSNKLSSAFTPSAQNSVANVRGVYAFLNLWKCFISARPSKAVPQVHGHPAGPQVGLGWQGAWGWRGRFFPAWTESGSQASGSPFHHPSPWDSIKLLGIPSKPTCSKFTSTASMTTCKWPRPLSPNPSGKREVGIVAYNQGPSS